MSPLIQQVGSWRRDKVSLSAFSQCLGSLGVNFESLLSPVFIFVFFWLKILIFSSFYDSMKKAHINIFYDSMKKAHINIFYDSGFHYTILLKILIPSLLPDPIHPS